MQRFERRKLIYHGLVYFPAYFLYLGLFYNTECSDDVEKGGILYNLASGCPNEIEAEPNLDPPGQVSTFYHKSGSSPYEKRLKLQPFLGSGP